MKHTSPHPQATLRVACLAFALLLTGSFLLAQPGSIDLSFNPTDRGSDMGDGANISVNVVAQQPNGKIIIGGAFTTYNGITRRGIARLNADGSLDTSFDPGTGTDYYINGFVFQPDGKILIGGGFTSYNGTTRNRIARLNADGSLDTSFNPGTGANDWVYVVALQPDGKILIIGRFTTYNGMARKYIARLNADGSLDTSFDPGLGANNAITAMTLQPDGKILIGGTFSSYNGTARNRIARLNANGSLDTGFDPGAGPNDMVQALAVLPDGKIFIEGEFTTYNGTARKYLARLNPDGSLDPGFDPGAGANNLIYGVGVLPDGKVVIGGNFTTYNGTARKYLARLNPDGSLDTSFDPGTGANDFIYTMTFQPDGKIIIGGIFTSYNGTTRNRIARLNSDGSLDTDFNRITGANKPVASVAFQPNGKILIGGTFTTYNGITRRGIARLNPDGSLDQSFDPGLGAYLVSSIALQPDGKIIIGGQFATFNGTTLNNIARLNPDGSRDTGFNPGMGANLWINDVVLQPDGKILIGGQFTTYNGTTRNRIARLNPDGNLDTGFDPGLGTNSFVSDVSLQPDGKILIGGQFTTYNGTSRRSIARLNANGSLDMGFDPGTGSSYWVDNIALQPDGKILIGGEFFTYNGTARNRIARLNANGSLDQSFDPGTGANSTIYAMALQPDGKVLIGGNFTTYNGAVRPHFARLKPNGSLDAGFDPGTGPDDMPSVIALQQDGKLIIGGIFTSYNGIGRNRIARINGGGDNDGPPPAQCLTLGDECSGNNQEIRRYTLNIASDGSYPLALTYRSHERSSQVRFRLNGGSWQSVPLAQTPSDLSYGTTNLGILVLQHGANSVELASGGGYICFRELCVSPPITPPGACLALDDACSGNNQEIRRYSLNTASGGYYPLTLMYRSHERATQLRLRINGGSWQTLALAQTPSDLSYQNVFLGSQLLQTGANAIELASGGGYVCFRQLCTGMSFVDGSRIGLLETEVEISQKLTVSPNPNGGEFEARFYAEPNRAAVLEVIDMQGHRLWSKGLQGEGWHSERVSLPRAATGSYLLRLLQDGVTSDRPQVIRVLIVK